MCALPLCMSMNHVCALAMETRRECCIFFSCEQPYACWELNPSLAKQSLLLTTELWDLKGLLEKEEEGE